MNWIKKAFMPKADDNLSDAMTTPQQLGAYLFELCMSQVAWFLKMLEDFQRTVKVDRKA